MRIAALIFALLGVAGSGFIGAKWLSDSKSEKVQMAVSLLKVMAASGDAKAQADLAKHDNMVMAAYAFLASAVLGVLGCVLVLKRKGAIAAAVFLVAFVTPVAILADWKPVIFTFGLALATLFALFVRPAAVVVRKRDDHIPADTDMV